MAPVGEDIPVGENEQVGDDGPVGENDLVGDDGPAASSLPKAVGAEAPLAPAVAEPEETPEIFAESVPAEMSDPTQVPATPEVPDFSEVAPSDSTLGEIPGVTSAPEVVEEAIPPGADEKGHETDFQTYGPIPESGALGFGSALDKILQNQVAESDLEEGSTAAGSASDPPKAQFIFPTSDPLSDRKDDKKEEVQESTAPKAFSDTVEKDYLNLVAMAEQIFQAAKDGNEPDSASVIDAIWRTLEQLRKNDELLEESVRQRRDYHSWSQRGANVAVLSIRLGVEVDCDERRGLALGLCGLMHDLGMLTITKDVLDSPRFNASQLKQLRQHPLESQKMIESFGESFAWVGKIVAQAHERQDGGGYPRGLKGKQIHEVASILGLADTYEAMSHPRPDRKARATYDALKEIVDRRNYQFDRRIIKALISIVSIFPLGSLVQLSNGEVGRVVRVSKNFPTRPSVEIILDPQGRTVNYTRFVVLENEPLLTIVDPAIPEDLLRK